ncbi:MAG: tRNA uridine(34) 5-carboxymethylaminomethyl modification radical SAM/GNAT enzyme Elp3 [Chloroflexota bacterium]
MRKFARTISGVTPVAVMTAPRECPGHCVYCPTYAVTPQSYTPESPAVLRARLCGYDTGEQIRLRLKALAEMGHPIDKIELIIMGGTFLAAPEDYQYRFIKECYDALNGSAAPTLAEAKQRNETAPCRCTGLCIETRPDWCGEAEVARMLEFGATRVELGVQTLSDDIYRLVRRGHTVADVFTATRRLKERGFKVYYHWMPGLPGMTPEADLAMFSRLFTDEGLRPDGLKIYPTMVIEGTELAEWHRAGRYQPYAADVMLNLIAEMKALVPGYVRLARVVRDIPSKFITAGLRNSPRNLIRERLREKGLSCRCIRCREYGHRLREGAEIGVPALKRMDYEASGGREVFLSFEDEGETLFGLLRLRLQRQPVIAGAPSAGEHAVIRELHVFGPEVPIRERKPKTAQHRGLGRALVAEAERIAAAESGAGQIAVLSGVGAREYYRDSGYRACGDYMVKDFINPARRDAVSFSAIP